MLGNTGGEIKSIVDHSLIVESNSTARIQEIHRIISHIICGLVEKKWENKLVKNILKNKNCLITGATGGIGKEICKQLANYSCNLFLTSTNTKKLKKLKDELKKINKNIKIESFESDLSIEDNINELINSIKEKFSSIDIVINSAGIFMIEPIEKKFN